MDKILTPNEKLKILRKKYGLKQFEITDNKIKRNTISMIETGKNNLTAKTAEILVKKMNQLLKEKGINETVSLEYLLEGVDEQVEKIERKYLKKLMETPNDERLIEEIDYFLMDKKDSKVKFNLYSKIGDSFYNKQSYFKAMFYYSKVFEYAIINETDNQLFSFTFNFITSLYYLRKYSELLKVHSLIEHHFDKYSSMNQMIISSIKRRVMIEKKMYKECLLDIGKNIDMDSLNNDEIYSQNIIHTQAECHYHLKNFSIAMELFEKMENSSFTKLKLLGMSGVALVYKELKNKTKLLEKLNILEDLIKNVKSNYVYKQEIYLNMAKCFSELGEIDKSEYYLNKILKVDKSYANLSITYNALEMLLNYYEDITKYEKINYLEKIILDWIDKKYLEKNDSLVFNLIQYYTNNNLIDNLKNFLEKI